MRVFTWRILLLLFSAVLVGANNTSAAAQAAGQAPAPPSARQTNYNSVTISNAGRTLVFDEPPARVVTLMQQDAELLLALGLGDRLVGYALVTAETPPTYARQLRDVPILAQLTPSKEAILAVEPDFIIGSQRSFLDNAAGTRARLAALGIQTYVTKARQPATLDNQVYWQIRDLARIFGVEQRGEQLIRSMRARISAISARVRDIEEPVKVFYMVGGQGGTVQTAAGDSLDSRLIELAGGRNIFAELDGYLAQVSWEAIIARNPDVIVLSYCCGGSPQALRKILADKPALQAVTAVREQRYVAVEVEQTTGSMRIPSGLARLARGFYPERFAGAEATPP
ncbi:MAG TPA: ABC transporter substrate-binding protein [Salinisphaeraceae bacterium]|nr:ABC transporter substrate-binding protein [Salinisphaeraceae bacterium]